MGERAPTAEELAQARGAAAEAERRAQVATGATAGVLPGGEALAERIRARRAMERAAVAREQKKLAEG